MARKSKRQSLLSRGSSERFGSATSHPRRRSLKSRTINFAGLDSDELERLEAKDLFLCVQLVNNDNVIVKIGKKTTAKQVLSHLQAYAEVKKLYKKTQALELVLSVCESLKLSSRPLPNYYTLYQLHDKGYWTRPFEYARCPLLTLRPASSAQDPAPPEVLQCSLDTLVHGGKAPNWSSNSREAMAFRLKYPLNDVWESMNPRYPQFIDSLPDPLLVGTSHVINIRLSSLPLTDTSVKITDQTTLRETLEMLRAKLKKLVDVDLDVTQKMLKVKGLCEYIWRWEVPLLQAEGVREALHTHQTPWLELVPRPASLEDMGSLPSFELYDVLVPMLKTTVEDILDNLDLTCFPVNDLAVDDDEALMTLIRSRYTAQPSDLPSYMEKRSTVFRSSIFLPAAVSPSKIPPPSPRLRKRSSHHFCYSSLHDTQLDINSDIDVRKLYKSFRLKVLGIDKLHMYVIDEISRERKERLAVDRVRVEVALYHGAVRLEESRCTGSAYSCKGSQGDFVETVRWQDWITFRLRYSQLPQATMIKFRVMASVSRPRESTQERDIAWVNFRIFDFANRMESGIHRIGLYPYYSLQDSTGSTSTNQDSDASQLFIQLESFLKPVIFGESTDANFDIESYLREMNAEIPSDDLRELTRIIQEHPLYELRHEEKGLLWTYRAYVSQTTGLPKLLESVDWCSPECVRDVHFLLQFCPLQTAQVGLELLDGKFADVKTRDYAVRCIDQMNNFECSLYLLQLVQALKFEPYHDSALARFLMKRALQHPFTFGHTFFWLLRSEIEDPYFQERFGLLLEQFVRKCGQKVHEILLFENYLIVHLEQVAKTVRMWGEEDSKEDVMRYLQVELDNINEEMPDNYPLAFNPKVRVCRIKVEECKIMKSKKKPLYLVFQGVDNEPDVHVLFKTGDDLRQDLVVLTILKIMENLWAEHGLDLRLSLYHCMPLASGTGMLEIVQQAETLAAVHSWGGGQRGVFSKKTLKKWLMAHNSGEDWVHNFVKSCAGYSVSTYVLGVADRHNDNIMLKYSGHIFHIDFGHFLGYFKRKMGIPRETAPFVFTSDFRYAMGGKKSKGFRDFLQLCVEAYNVLRRNRRLFITLLCLMLCSGIPEITRRDIGFLLKTLPGDLSDEAAGKSFLAALSQALGSIMTRVNFAIHLWATSAPRPKELV